MQRQSVNNVGFAGFGDYLDALDASPAAPVSVTVNIDIEELKQVILVALTPHPKARIDVAAALVEYDDGKAGGEQ